MRIALIVESQDSNSLGRAYCLWLLARALDWAAPVLTTQGTQIWAPLAGTEFEKDVHKVAADELTSAIPADTDLIVAVKPLPRSLGEASKLAKALGLPMLIDIDDPDLEVRRRAGSPLMAMLRWIRRPFRSIEDLRLSRVVRKHPTLVSNPWLQARYGGTLMPHTRLPIDPGPIRDTADLQIAFVGTRHPHKGVEVLRAATAALQSDESATTLVITDDPPTDAMPWESWVGRTSLAKGIEIARNADAIVLPSLDNRYANGQLPVKLVDAMMLGRAIVVTDVDPLPWSVGSAGIVVLPGSTTSLVTALRKLRDPSTRRRLGTLAVERAEEEFSLRVLAPRFEYACQKALETALSVRSR